jgi:hypothetical protein
VVNNCSPRTGDNLRSFMEVSPSIPLLGVDAALLDDSYYFYKTFGGMLEDANKSVSFLIFFNFFC